MTYRYLYPYTYTHIHTHTMYGKNFNSLCIWSCLIPFNYYPLYLLRFKDSSFFPYTRRREITFAPIRGVTLSSFSYSCTQKFNHQSPNRLHTQVYTTEEKGISYSFQYSSLTDSSTRYYLNFSHSLCILQTHHLPLYSDDFFTPTKNKRTKKQTKTVTTGQLMETPKKVVVNRRTHVRVFPPYILNKSSSNTVY